MPKKIIFSGIQPTGGLHLGNYFGAIKNWVDLQADYQCIYQIVDYHGITAPFDPEKISSQALDLAAQIIACGINPKKSLFTVQSMVPEHTELAWILGCISPFAMLERMPTYKEKAEQHKSQLNFGLFAYPVLQAADILLYKGQAVPVGEDQDPHIEFARYLAKTFNRKFKQIFPEPQTLKTETSRILGLDGQFKMSKSRGNDVGIVDAPDVIRKKFKKATTDSGKEIKFAKNKPAISNLLKIYQLCSGISEAEAEKRMQDKGYAEFKAELAEAVISYFQPIRKKYLELTEDQGQVLQILKTGARECQEIAKETMKEVKAAIGLRY